MSGPPQDRRTISSKGGQDPITKVLHPQDAIPLIAGIHAFLSPIWTTTTMPMAVTAWIVGAVTLVVSLADVQLSRTHRPGMAAH